MSTTVTYRGNTLTTVNNETKSLLTAGSWLEDDIEITDEGGTVVVYKDSDGYIVIGSEDCGVDGLVSKDSDGYIVIPEELITEIKLQGKTATPTEEYQAIYPDSGYDGLEYVGVDPIPSAYADVTDTTAVATDVAAGKIFYTSEGVRTSGTASGGGGDDVWSGMVDRTISQAIDSMGSISMIGAYAFAGCRQLTYASFSNATIINSHAFELCTSFSSVYLPNVSVIKFAAFSQCTAMQTADFPIVERIESCAFQSCASLHTINAPNLTSIFSSAFYKCYSLNEANFPKANHLGSGAFYQCSRLSTACFPQVSNVQYAAFAFCSCLLTADFENATDIGSYAFSNCYELTTVYFPNAKVIRQFAFYNCSALSNVTLPKVETLSGGVFAGAINASAIILGYSASSVSGNILGSAFSRCEKLLSLYLLKPTIYPLGHINAFQSTPISTYTTRTSGVHGSIFVPESLYNSYIIATNWLFFSSRFVSLTDAQVQHVIDYGTHEME